MARLVDDWRREHPRTVEHERYDWDREHGVARDQVRWGSIWGGAVVTIATSLVLGVLGAAIGWTVGTGGEVGGAEIGWGIFTAVSAFFLGGYVSGRTASVSGPALAALNGAMVWALGLVGTLLLTALGIGAAAGLLNAFGLDEGLPRFFGQDTADRLWWTFAAMVIGLVVASLGGLLGSPGDTDVSRTGEEESRS